MDDSKYIDLRDRLRKRSSELNTLHAAIASFIHAIEAHVNKTVGRERTVCIAGSLHGETFEAGSFTASGTTMRFAYMVIFNDINGKELLAPVVEFIASSTAGSLMVHCIDTGMDADIKFAESGLAEARETVAMLIESAVSMKVEKALEKLGNP